MIDRSEILDVATDLSLAPEVVEKDYILGWLLAGIYGNEELASTWTFKGGTCLKKCYFETYRFSEDLDFTIAAEAQMDDGFLTSDQIRDIVDSRDFTVLATHPMFSTRDFKAVPAKYRALVPEYVKDYVSLNQFAA